MTGNGTILFSLVGKKQHIDIYSCTLSGRSAVVCEYLERIVRHMQGHWPWLTDKNLTLTFQKGAKTWKFEAKLGDGPECTGKSKSCIPALDSCLRNLITS